MTELSGNRRAFLRSMGESPELEQHGFRLLLQRQDFTDFFDALKAAGFFAREKNPAPQESGGLIKVPYWPALDYLRRCAEHSSGGDHDGLGAKIMAIVRDLSREGEGYLRDNSHTADVFAQIIGLVPTSVVGVSDVRLVSQWLRVRFGDGRVAYALDRGAATAFLNSDMEEDWRKALEIFRQCTDFSWEEGEDEPRAIVEGYWLGELVKRHAAALGKKLGMDTVKLFEERLRIVFGRGDRNRRSDMIRPAIEEHEQNRRTKAFENCLVAGIRDALLAWCGADGDAAKVYVRELLESEFQILRRVGIYVTNERWDVLSGLYGETVGPGLFDSAHIHELYALLNQRFEALSDEAKRLTLRAIEELEVSGRDDPEKARKLAQARWLEALKDTTYEPMVTFRRALREEVGDVGSEHPDFRVYIGGHWGPGRTPYGVAELVGFLEDGIIAERLDSFEPSPGWRGASRDGLVAALEAAVAAFPREFIAELPQLARTKTAYRCGTLHALREIRDESEGNGDGVSWAEAWPQVIGFLEDLTTGAELWERVNRESGVDAMVSAIGDLLELGTREGTRAYPDELLPRGLRLVRRLLDGVEPSARGDEADPMTAAINTTKVRRTNKSPILAACRYPRRVVVELGQRLPFWPDCGIRLELFLRGS